MNPSDGEIDRLLARGGLGGAGREQILEQLLTGARETARRPQRWRLWLSATTLALSAAAALVLVVSPGAHEPEFRAKGPATGTPVLDVGCPPASLGACRPGSTLVFSVLGAVVPGHLQAWADRTDGDGRIWYLSAETETAALVPGPGTQPVRSGVRIGDEHIGGRYLVHVVLSTAPLTRGVLLAGTGDGVLAHATFPMTVVAP
jgi:hypothetical protein